MSSETLRMLTQPSRERLSNQIAHQIKKLIISKRIQVGEKLPTERELSETTKVSRVVVREALRTLELSGFVEIKTGPNGGSFVSDKTYMPISNSIYDLLNDGNLSLQHFCEARLSIEISSIQLTLQNVTNQDLEDLDCINAKMLDEPGSSDRFPYNNMEFHVKIAEISGNPLMKLLSEAILNILIMLYPNHKSSMDFIKATYKRHNAIIDAMKKKDSELCERAISEDVGMTKNMFNT
jgi:GntR family transcriptional repressor for pyruvate dehydrogenase complex